MTKDQERDYQNAVDREDHKNDLLNQWKEELVNQILELQDTISKLEYDRF